MLIPSGFYETSFYVASLSRRVNANSQPLFFFVVIFAKLIKKGEC